ncbi:hypothetical protein GGR09_001153 [Bartonella heixiaziensis]
MKEKIIELYDLDEETASLLRRESDASRTSFTIKTSDPLRRETVGEFVRLLNLFSQNDLEKFKQILEALHEAKRAKNATVVEEC